jgi:hypothetical protein
MRAAGLKLAAAVVEGLPQTDRNMAAIQTEAWKLFDKQVKVQAAATAHAKLTKQRHNSACASSGNGCAFITRTTATVDT